LSGSKKSFDALLAKVKAASAYDKSQAIIAEGKGAAAKGADGFDGKQAIALLAQFSSAGGYDKAERLIQLAPRILGVTCHEAVDLLKIINDSSNELRALPSIAKKLLDIQRKFSIISAFSGNYERGKAAELLLPIKAPEPPAPPPLPPSLTGAVTSWSAAQVAEWVKQLGPSFEPYAAAFVEKAVDGASLVAGDLDDNFLETRIDVKPELHRRRILREIEALKPKKT